MFGWYLELRPGPLLGQCGLVAQVLYLKYVACAAQDFLMIAPARLHGDESDAHAALRISLGHIPFGA